MWNILLWFREAFKGIFRNSLLNAFVIVLSVASFALLALFSMLGYNAKFIAANQEDKMPIVVYLKNDVTDFSSIEQKLLALPDVKEVELVTKEEAYQVMENDLGERSNMLTELDFNPFPNSFEVKLNDTEQIKKIVKTIDTWGIDKSIKYGEEYLQSFFEFTDSVNNISFYIIIILSLTTGIAVYSSIRLNILNRNKEIEIKNLVGAGQLNTRVPFILEALILTVGSAAVVLIAVKLLYEKALLFLTNGLPIVNFLSTEKVLTYITPSLLGLAVIIALISGFLSTQRYLKRH